MSTPIYHRLKSYEGEATQTLCGLTVPSLREMSACLAKGEELPRYSAAEAQPTCTKCAEVSD